MAWRARSAAPDRGVARRESRRRTRARYPASRAPAGCGAALRLSTRWSRSPGARSFLQTHRHRRARGISLAALARDRERQSTRRKGARSMTDHSESPRRRDEPSSTSARALEIESEREADRLVRLLGDRAL